MSNYGMSCTLSTNDLESAEHEVIEALKEEGFGVLTEIDVTATLKKKIDVDFRPYKILGTCNPNLAHRALNIEPEVGLLLPCNVVLQQVESKIEVSILDPLQMANIIPGDEMKSLMQEVQEKLKRVISKIAGG